MNGQAKIELMLELKNKLKAGLNQAKRETVKGVGEMQKKMNTLKFNFTKHSKAIADEVPFIGNAFKMATNPIALTAAGILAVGKGIDYTTQKAADFNTQFRTLANLNLDKSKREIDSLKRMVLDTSYNKGFDTNKSITGYFDVQSTTGKFGGEVRRIVEQQGEFANLMQADFNNYIAGTAKGMANFGFGEEKLKEYNRSAYATVKVGVTTFDQLAQVQSVYAGAAASNNQTFDTANKMLALFTVKTKSVDEAATLTKSMFNDLTKDATIKAFKKVGISIYDNNGAIKQGDTLMLELNKKFAGLDKDKQVVSLKNQFSGSEGLIAMIQAATDKSGQLQSTFENFNSAKLDMDKTMQLAKNDLNYQNEILRNKLAVMEIEIGTALLPLKYKIAELKLATVELVNSLTLGAKGMFDKGAGKANDKYFDLINNAQYMDKDTFVKNLAELKLDIAQTERDKLPTDLKSLWMYTGNPITYFTKLGYNKLMNSEGEGKVDQMKNIESLLIKNWKATTNSGLNPLKKEDSIVPLNPNNQGGSTTTPAPLGDNLDAVTGSARQVRNLTVNIEAFNKGGINTDKTTLQHMEPTVIEQWFTDMCKRIIHSVEVSY
ncbi:phage tail tape measure protein [Bacteroides neonati]|uniref:phage tail tape measure protein n=1 Tax=Bacteroides neonati TaxID=1347393 RepID=UPI001651EAA2|nr:phage tail tape measure protein [Bacteroides neonati]